MLYVNASPSISVPVNVIFTVTSSSVDAVTLLTTGASLTASTVIVTVAVLPSTVPSFALKVNVSSPFQS